MAGLSDCKYTGKDCTVMLGITSPYTHELPQYLGYDITKFKNYIRFLEIVLNREGESNNVVGLYFDGATNYFEELPPPNNKEELNKVINNIDNITKKKVSVVLMLLSERRRKTMINLLKRFNKTTFA